MANRDNFFGPSLATQITDSPPAGPMTLPGQKKPAPKPGFLRRTLGSIGDTVSQVNDFAQDVNKTLWPYTTPGLVSNLYKKGISGVGRQLGQDIGASAQIAGPAIGEAVKRAWYGTEGAPQAQSQPSGAQPQGPSQVGPTQQPETTDWNPESYRPSQPAPTSPSTNQPPQIARPGDLTHVINDPQKGWTYEPGWTSGFTPNTPYYPQQQGGGGGGGFDEVGSRLSGMGLPALHFDNERINQERAMGMRQQQSDLFSQQLQQMGMAQQLPGGQGWDAQRAHEIGTLLSDPMLMNNPALRTQLLQMFMKLSGLPQLDTGQQPQAGAQPQHQVQQQTTGQSDWTGRIHAALQGALGTGAGTALGGTGGAALASWLLGPEAGVPITLAALAGAGLGGFGGHELADVINPAGAEAIRQHPMFGIGGEMVGGYTGFGKARPWAKSLLESKWGGKAGSAGSTTTGGVGQAITQPPLRQPNRPVGGETASWETGGSVAPGVDEVAGTRLPTQGATTGQGPGGGTPPAELGPQGTPSAAPTAPAGSATAGTTTAGKGGVGRRGTRASSKATATTTPQQTQLQTQYLIPGLTFEESQYALNKLSEVSGSPVEKLTALGPEALQQALLRWVGDTAAIKEAVVKEAAMNKAMQQMLSGTVPQMQEGTPGMSTTLPQGGVNPKVPIGTNPVNWPGQTGVMSYEDFVASLTGGRGTTGRPSGMLQIPPEAAQRMTAGGQQFGSREMTPNWRDQQLRQLYQQYLRTAAP